MANLIRRAAFPAQGTPNFWDPFRIMFELMGEPHRELRHVEPAFVPTFEVFERKDAYVFKADLPGIKQEDLDIRIDGNTLSVSGERKFEKDEKRENFRRVERRYGSFSRSFELPSSADRDNITANFKDGILQIEVPKRAEARGKQIQIGGGETKAPAGTAKEKSKAA